MVHLLRGREGERGVKVVVVKGIPIRLPTQYGIKAAF